MNRSALLGNRWEFPIIGKRVPCDPPASWAMPRQPASKHGIVHGIERGDTMSLTVKAVEAARPQERPYKLTDGGWDTAVRHQRG